MSEDQARRDLERQLDQSERLIWHGRPGQRRLLVFAYISALVFMSIWTLAAILWTGFTFDQGWLIEPFEYEMDRWLPLFGLPFIVLGFIGLYWPARGLYLAYATIYGLTNFRIVILQGSSVHSFRAPDLQHTERSGNDQRGTLKFAQGPKEQGARPRAVLLNIEKPREVEALIRATLLNG